MKQLSIEEKAKCYDKAIKQIEECTPDENGFITIYPQEIFPELAESEDEKIRKELLAFAQDRKAKYPNDPKYVNIDAWIDWLEKQNQNLEKLKLEKGKWYFCIEDYHPRADCTDFYQGEKYRCEKDGVMGVWCIKNPEKYFRECETPTYAGSDAVRIQSIIQVLEYARSLSAYNQFGKDDITKDIAWLEKQGKQNPAWSEEDEIALGDALWCCKQAASIAKDENDAGNIWYAENWLKSLKDRVQPRPRQEWSKKDENNILFLTSIIEECFKDKEKITLCGDTVCANFTKKDVIDRLKSLRPQNTWKPSTEQMKALSFINTTGGISYVGQEQELINLYNDLKKLREE